MAVFSVGRIAVKPIKLVTALSLEDILQEAQNCIYPRQPEQPSEGWASPESGENHLDVPVSIPPNMEGELRVTPEQLSSNGQVIIPRLLRLRYYWDHPNIPLQTIHGRSVRWEEVYTRRAFDVVIFDDKEDIVRSVLLSTREYSVRVSALLKAVKDLGGHDAAVHTKSIKENFPSDFFMWLLWRLQLDAQLGEGVTLESIREISVRDRLWRGGKIVDQANLDRIEILALIAFGGTTFGPAKVGLGVPQLQASFDVELYPDGGFIGFRTSKYDDAVLMPQESFGHSLVEDMWGYVLPCIRKAYLQDDDWVTKGRHELETMAESLVRKALSPGV